MNLKFSLVESEIIEDLSLPMQPDELVKFLALEKAKKASNLINSGIIISADTIVVLDKLILGKPENPENAFQMLKQLSGREHSVYTGFTIFDMPSAQFITDFECTLVRFMDLNDDLIKEYIETGSPFDKAGSYGVQDAFGSVFVERINGCYYNVMGFPVSKFYRTAKNFIETIKT